MHMLSRKDLSSDELDTLRRSKNPTVMVTANGEVQTNEEAQDNVHDLDLFVTVQLLEETLAFLSLETTLRRPRIFLRVGQQSKNTDDQRGEDNYMLSYILLFPSCPPIVVAIRRQHRHRRICLQQVQLKTEVTN